MCGGIEMIYRICEVLSYGMLAVITVYITIFSIQINKQVRNNDKNLGNK